MRQYQTAMAKWILDLNAPIVTFTLVVENFQIAALAMVSQDNGFDPDDIGVPEDVSGWRYIASYIPSDKEQIAFAQRLANIPSLKTVNIIHSISGPDDAGENLSVPILAVRLEIGPVNPHDGGKRNIRLVPSLSRDTISRHLDLANDCIKSLVSFFIYEEREMMDSDFYSEEDFESWTEEHSGEGSVDGSVLTEG